MEPAELRAFRVADHRRRRNEMMAAFCRFWNVTPAEYKALTLEELEAMTEYANKEINERKKQQRKQQRR